jgi:hypothetical protein
MVSDGGVPVHRVEPTDLLNAGDLEAEHVGGARGNPTTAAGETKLGSKDGNPHLRRWVKIGV